MELVSGGNIRLIAEHQINISVQTCLFSKYIILFSQCKGAAHLPTAFVHSPLC